MIAAQLVPLLANMDTQLLIQMLQVTNPAVAATLSAYCAQAATAPVADPRQTTPGASPAAVPAASPKDVPPELLHNTSDVSSASAPAHTTSVVDSVRCGSAASYDSNQSSVFSSEGLGFSVAPPSNRPSRHPSSTMSSSSEMQDTASTLRPTIYTCHLCAFRSSNKTRFSEHLSVEFSVPEFPHGRRSSPDTQPTLRKRCRHCAFSTFLSEEFDDHVRIHHSVDSYRCTVPDCDYEGPSIRAVQLHFRRSHPKMAFVFQNSVSTLQSQDGQTGSHTPSVNLDPVVKLRRINVSN